MIRIFRRKFESDRWECFGESLHRGTLIFDNMLDHAVWFNNQTHYRGYFWRIESDR